jgi:predicted nucleic acid-binding protein
MASRDVLVDTSGLYALIDRKDAHHGAARRKVEMLVRAGRALVVTDYIVSDSATLAKARSGSPAALRVLDLVEQSVAIRVERIDRDRFDATKAYFRRHIDHGYSFTDCSSFILMRELRMREALTTDSHFAEAGFTALLAAAS